MELTENLRKFFRSLKLSLIPHRYKLLFTNSFNDSLGFFLSLIALSIIMMVLIMIPSMFKIHNQLLGESDNFEKLSFNFDAKQSKPIIIGLRTPQIIIDATGNTTMLKEGSLLITDKFIDYKILGLTDRINITEYNDLTKKDSSVVNLVFYSGIFILPSVLIWLYIAQFFKYLLLIIIMAILGAAYSTMMKYELSFKQSFIIATYASSIMVILDTLLLPFNFGIYVLQFPIFLNYGISLVTFFISLTIYAIAIIMTGNKEYREF